MLREEADQRILDWAMWIHLSALAGVLGAPIPFGNLVVPAVLWLMKGKEHPYIDEQGREALNFQITMMIYYGVGILLTIVLIGFVILPILGILNIVFVIKAALAARDGYHYKYPMTIRFLAYKDETEGY